MKKLLAPITLLFLVACQPSELERCIAVNYEPPINNYIKKHNLYLEQASITNSDGSLIDGGYKKWKKSFDRFYNNLNPMEDIVNDCVSDMDVYDKDLTYSEYLKREKQNAESCMISTANEVKEAQLIMEAENTEKAKSICNAQGIY